MSLDRPPRCCYAASMPQDPGRQNPAEGVPFLPGRPTVVFLTVRTEAHTSWLANADALSAVTQAWLQAEGWLVGDYLLMPDHLHCFCSPTDERFSIEQWIAYWKRLCRKTHGREEWRFQSRGWHHRLRQEESYAEKWDYVRANPYRAGLIGPGEKWPYQGRIHDLRW